MRSNIQVFSVGGLQQAAAHRRVKALRETLVEGGATRRIEADHIADLDAVCVRAVRVTGLRSGCSAAKISQLSA